MFGFPAGPAHPLSKPLVSPHMCTMFPVQARPWATCGWARGTSQGQEEQAGDKRWVALVQLGVRAVLVVQGQLVLNTTRIPIITGGVSLHTKSMELQRGGAWSFAKSAANRREASGFCLTIEKL